LVCAAQGSNRMLYMSPQTVHRNDTILFGMTIVRNLDQ